MALSGRFWREGDTFRQVPSSAAIVVVVVAAILMMARPPRIVCSRRDTGEYQSIALRKRRIQRVRADTEGTGAR